MPQFVSRDIHAAAVHHSQLATIGMNQRAPVLVVGMHNSGTSILTELLHASGVFFAASMQHHESHFFQSLSTTGSSSGDRNRGLSFP
jgi:hypothetical protein